MRVGVKDGVDVRQAVAQRLFAKVRPGVDHHHALPAAFIGAFQLLPPQQDRGPQATVARIRGGAHRTITTQRRHPHRGTRSQECEATLHRPR
jgi:hypothetical protein